ncbi:MAG: hypothetical protein HN350_21320 [Phycisphaerales bacterium]|nr:hypothetical protein [Phycisphaerales bacterium]
MELINDNGDVLFTPYTNAEAASILWDETREGGKLSDHRFAVSLAVQMFERSYLSQAQLWWVHELVVQLDRRGWAFDRDNPGGFDVQRIRQKLQQK